MNILIGIGLTYLIYNLFFKWIEKKWLLNIEPFNCQFCISLWVTIALIICYLDPLYLTLPLAYHLTTRLINKI